MRHERHEPRDGASPSDLEFGELPVPVDSLFRHGKHDPYPSGLVRRPFTWEVLWWGRQLELRIRDARCQVVGYALCSSQREIDATFVEMITDLEDRE